MPINQVALDAGLRLPHHGLALIVFAAFYWLLDARPELLARAGRGPCTRWSSSA